jgi:hypothetical protein
MNFLLFSAKLQECFSILFFFVLFLTFSEFLTESAYDAQSSPK